MSSKAKDYLAKMSNKYKINQARKLIEQLDKEKSTETKYKIKNY